MTTIHSPNSPSWPLVSVIVPVRNGARTISGCIDALLAQDYPGPEPQLIVIDNASTDGTASLLHRYRERVELVNQPVRGASAARNAGIMRAGGELVAMTDADCVPRMDWLRHLAEAAVRNPGAAVIGGRIVADDAASGIAYFAELLFDQRQAIEGYDRPYVITANAIARRSDLLRFGLFNEAFPRGQDVELSFRAGFRFGARFAYCDEAVVNHHNVRSLAELWLKGLQHGAASALIRREFKAELGRSPREQLKQWAPYRAALFEAAAWMRRRVDGAQRSHAPDRDFPLYAALFGLAKQLGYSYHILRNRA